MSRFGGFPLGAVRRAEFALYGLESGFAGSLPVGQRVEAFNGGTIGGLSEGEAVSRVVLQHVFLAEPEDRLAGRLAVTVETPKVDSTRWAAHEFINRTRPELGFGHAFRAEVDRLRSADWPRGRIVVDGKRLSCRVMRPESWEPARPGPELCLVELTDDVWAGRRLIGSFSPRFGELRDWRDYASVDVRYGELSLTGDWLIVKSQVWPPDPVRTARSALRMGTRFAALLKEHVSGATDKRPAQERGEADVLTAPVDVLVDGAPVTFQAARDGSLIGLAASLDGEHGIEIWGRWDPDKLKLQTVSDLSRYENSERLEQSHRFNLGTYWVALAELPDGNTLWLSGEQIELEDVRLRRIADIDNYVAAPGS